MKQRTFFLRADVQHCQAERLSQTLALVKLRTERDSIRDSVRVELLKKARDRQRLRRARLENWGWRSLAALAVYLKIRSLL